MVEWHFFINLLSRVPSLNEERGPVPIPRAYTRGVPSPLKCSAATPAAHPRHIRSHLFAGGAGYLKKPPTPPPRAGRAQSLLCITSPSLNLVASIFCFLIARRSGGVGWVGGGGQSAEFPPPAFFRRLPKNGRSAIERRRRRSRRRRRRVRNRRCSKHANESVKFGGFGGDDAE